MRFRLFALWTRVFIIVLAIVTLVHWVKGSGPRANIDNQLADLGVLKPGQAAEHVFKIKNTGDGPLVLDHIQASCGCTILSSQNAVIPPHETFELKARMTAQNYAGTQAVAIAFDSNDPSVLREKLMVKALVDPSVVFRPQVIDIGEVAPEKLPAKERVVIEPVFNRKLKKLRIEDPKEDDYIQADIVQSTNPDQAVVNVTVTSGAPWGNMDRFLVISSEDGLRLSIPIVGRIIGPIHSDPSSIFWGKISKQNKVDQNVTLFGFKGNDFEITVSPKSFANYVQCKWINENSLNVSLSREIPLHKFKADLLLKRKTEDSVVLDIPMYGIVE